METEFINTKLAQRAKTVYERDIQQNIQPEDAGKYLVIDLETGEPVSMRWTRMMSPRRCGCFR